MRNVADSITNALSDFVGAALDRVTIRALPCDIRDQHELMSSRFYIGGEVCFEFSERSLFVSWDEGAGWEDHFSIGARRGSFFSGNGGLVDWDVRSLGPWSNCVAQGCSSARVLAIGGTPHIVELRFGRQNLWLADGAQLRLGDGDDLIIGFGDAPSPDGAEVLWSA